MDLSPGATLGSYRIERLIGRGGMGEVYLATDTSLGRRVAIKLLPPYLASQSSFRGRFLAESRLAASLDHPHIVPVYEASEIDGRLALVMRYVEGEDLGRILAREGAVSGARAVAFLTGVADALDAAHERGLVHRDVKPSNILVADGRRGPHAYLADFGLVKELGTSGDATASGMLVGSASYVAPEQIEGRPVDGRADVYSLACVLTEALTGRPPYSLDRDLAVLWAHIHADRPRPSAHDATLRAFDAVVAKGMAVDPADRYATAGELMADAASAASGAMTSAASAAPSTDQAPPTAVTSALRGSPADATRRGPGSVVPLPTARRRAAIGGVVAVGAIVLASMVAAGLGPFRPIVGSRSTSPTPTLAAVGTASPSPIVTPSPSPVPPSASAGPGRIPVGARLSAGLYATTRFRPIVRFEADDGWTTVGSRFGDDEQGLDLTRVGRPGDRVTVLYSATVSNTGCIEDGERLRAGGDTYPPDVPRPNVPGSLLFVDVLRQEGILGGDPWLPTDEGAFANPDADPILDKVVTQIDVAAERMPRCREAQEGVALLRRYAPSSGRLERDEWVMLPVDGWARIMPAPVGVVIEEIPADLVLVVQAPSRAEFEAFLPIALRLLDTMTIEGSILPDPG